MTQAYVNLGAQRYAVQRHWVDASVDLSGITSVAVLDGGHVAALFRVAPQVRLFDADGQMVEQWHVPNMVCPHHITAVPGGGVLLTDVDGHQVVCLDAGGNVQWTLGDPDHPQWMAPFNHPTQAALDRDGNIYVTDGYGNFCVHFFDSSRALLQTYGGQGQEPGRFSTPHAVVIDDTGRVYVADRENNRVQIFDNTGHFQSELTGVFKPMALALTPHGDLVVSDQTATLSLFGTTGEIWGRCRVFGVYGHGLAVGPDSTIYISEMIPDCLTRLQPVCD